MTRWKRILAGAVVAAACVGAVWGVWTWVRYPKRPDVAKASLDQCIDFLGKDDFTRLFERHRRQYVEAVAKKLGEKSFAELLQMMMDSSASEQRRQVRKNIEKLPERDQIGAQFMAVFLEKFYQQPETLRTQQMAAMVVTQQLRRQSDPKRFQLPNEEKFKQDMAKVLSTHSPHTQAMFGQFMLDLRRQREAMGIKGPTLK